MKSLKMNGLSRLLAFVLIAVILISFVSIAVGGRQSNTENEPDSGNIGDTSDETDENKDGTPSGDLVNDNGTVPPQNEPVIEAPKYYSTMTGLEITEDQSKKSPVAFLVDSNAPLYGISSADITIEIPTEDGGTRLLAFHTKTDTLWKIGSLAPSRAFISSISNLLGGIIVSRGCDDILKYDTQNYSSSNLDLDGIYDSYYVENTKYIYSSIDRILEAIDKNSTVKQKEYKTPPYILSDTSVVGTASANSVILPYSNSSETTLYYSASNGKYVFYKSGVKAVDKLCGSEISYKNVFVLFANSTTYESADGKELIIDTVSGGSGYYVSEGTLTEIEWCLSDDGSLVFKTLSGDVLSVNKGNSYIAYYKASVSSEVTFR